MKIDISSKQCDLSQKLSNFSEFHFYVDGVFCASMEGFLQSLKFDDVEKQIEVCSLVGKQAKFKGKKKKWYLNQLLYWQGEKFKRDSDEYQNLLDKAFSELFKNSEYKILLFKTGDSLITHSMGKSNIKETVLTEEEFCSRLMILRHYNRK